MPESLWQQDHQLEAIRWADRIEVGCEEEALRTITREDEGRNLAGGYSVGCVVLRGPWEDQGQTGQQLLD